MPTNFPSGLDDFQNPAGSTTLANNPGLRHSAQHSNLNDAVEALERKVGADDSGDTSSHDYKIRRIIPPLPVPNVKISSDRSDGPSDDTRGPISSIGTRASQTLSIRRTPYVVATGIPEELFAEDYELRLELMHYVSQGGGTKVKRGYVHPAHTTPSGDGSFTHGGLQNGGPGNDVSNSPRPTEWPIYYNQQRVDMNQLHGWFTLRNLIYRNAAGATASFIAPVPSFKKNKNGRRYGSFGYSSAYQPCYFAWRYSILDPTDNVNEGRRKRITGPMSPVVAVGTTRFLLRFSTFFVNQKRWSLPGFSYTAMNSWFAKRAR